MHALKFMQHVIIINAIIIIAEDLDAYTVKMTFWFSPYTSCMMSWKSA